MRIRKSRVWDINKKVFIPTDTYGLITTDFGAFGVMLKDWEDYREGEYMYPNAQTQSDWTGLNENGTDVYEGFIYKAKFRTNEGDKDVTGFIQIDEYMWCLNCGEEIYSINRLHDFIEIGNIYENPEMLAQ